MDLCDQGRDIHHGDDGLAGIGHLACEQRAVGDDAVDGRADLGVTESGLRGLVLALSRLAGAFRVLDGGGLAHRVQRIHVLFGDIVSCLGLHESSLRRFKIAARGSSLFQQILASIEDVLRDVKIGLGLGKIEPGLLRDLRRRRPWWW